MNHFHVDPEQLRSHAKNVGDIASGVSSAGSALPGGPDENALGPFVQFLTAGLGAAMSQTAAAFAQASSTVDSMRERLVKAADSYQNVDGEGADRLRAEAGK